MDANAWLREYQQDVQSRLARAEQVKEQVNAATGSARSADGTVLATVGPTGALQDLQLSPKADNMTSTQLAQLILRTSREAHRKVAEQMAQAVKPLIGDSEAMSFLESQIPPAEEPQAQDQASQDEPPQWGQPQQQQQPPQRPARPSRPAWDDDNDDNGPILR
ncbi:YbaB/EbfC family nucleoid-associated protein [Kutzneria buriramensis]|uniref:YbaB/EbfC DNA-binding family protein n=1 Tax=Kutzneria buriramensis TaxID=1045776 RepID=A0A3E0HQH0_9PSEU|nr:YbaB/EbfC family nucleoid-associated protein [Kutzneria buriramensis]REH48510.1 YbaB/EbfC DNA-binding family protein [Kutzneria buriramensis]